MKNTNLKIVLFLFILIFLLKLPVLNAPLFEDAAWLYFYKIRDIAGNNFKPILSEDYDYSEHPPFFLEIWALVYRIFGYNLYAFNIMALFFAFLTLYFTYLLGRLIYDSKIGFYSSLVLLFLPLFFVSSTRLELTLPLTALTVASIYFFLKQKKYVYLFTATCLVLTKEQGVLIVIPLLTYIILRNFKKSKLILIKELFFYSIPLFIFMAWLIYKYLTINLPIYEYLITNSIMNNWNMNQVIHQTFIGYMQNFYRLNKILFFDQFIFLLTIPLIYYIYKYLSNPQIVKKFELKFIIPLSIIFLFMFCFSFFNQFTVDQVLPIYPLFIIFSVKSIFSIFKNKSKYVIFIIILLFIWQWNVPSYRWTLNPKRFMDKESSFSWNDMTYLNYFKVQKEAFSYISDNYPSSIVLSDFGKTEKMLFPSLGYVKKTMNVLNPKEYFHYKAPYKDIKEISSNSFQFLILGKGWDLEGGVRECFTIQRHYNKV